jgi:exodeoxyribonuclease VII large subunit
LASAVFRNPLLPVRNAEQQVDELGIRLVDLARGLLAEARAKLQAGYEQVVKIEPHRLLSRRTVDLNDVLNRASAAIRTVINRGRMGLTAQENRLAALNPKSVLQRGYSITTAKKTGLLIKKPKDIKVGDYLITELAEENLIESKVTSKRERQIRTGLRLTDA